MSKQLSTKQKLNKLLRDTEKEIEKEKKLRVFREKTIFVVEGEFDMTKLQDLPFGIVDYCLSFLTARDKEQNLPSRWFQRLAFEELRRVWNTETAPAIRKRFEKMSTKQLIKLTENCYDEKYFTGVLRGGRQTKKDYINTICVFPRMYNSYSYQRQSCVEVILLSKGFSPATISQGGREFVDLDPFASAKITLKDLQFNSL
jgi:hypothetical protein